MECGTAEVMSREERCHTEGIKVGRRGVEKRGNVEVMSPL